MELSSRPTISEIRRIVRDGGADELAVELHGRILGSADHGVFVSSSREASAHSGAAGAAATAGDGPLAGVPFAVKDNIDTADLPTTAGTPALLGSHPGADAPVVAALRAAGGQVIGKTNLHELALGITNNNASTGPVSNPADPMRSAGGSSGGSAVAVALGVVPFALGTDTGGSVRIPAAHTGVVGFRPTTDRWGAQRVVPLSTSRDTIGVLANTVDDVASVDAAVTGDGHQPDLALSGTRIGVPRSGFFDDLDPEVATCMDRALGILADAGAELIELSVPGAHTLDAACGFPLVFREIADAMPGYLARLPAPYCDLTLADIAEAVVSPDVAAVLEAILADPVPDTVYHEALATRLLLQQRYAATFLDHRVDALIHPTVSLLPPPLGQDATILHNGREVDVFAASIRNTAPGSVAGQPALSLPAGVSEAGLPIGLGLEGPVDDDRRLLALGARVTELLAT